MEHPGNPRARFIRFTPGTVHHTPVVWRGSNLPFGDGVRPWAVVLCRCSIGVNDRPLIPLVRLRHGWYGGSRGFPKEDSMRDPDGRIQLEDDNSNAVRVGRALLGIDDQGNDLPEPEECEPSKEGDSRERDLNPREGGLAP